MMCNSVRAAFVGALFTPPVGWLKVFLRATETCPNCEKEITTCQGLKNAENSTCSSYTGFGPALTTMTKLLACWPAILTQMSASFFATVCRISNLCSGQRRSQGLRCLQIVALFAVLFVDCEEHLCILDGSCQVLVMQSFAFSFRLRKVGSLIEWDLSSSFRICR